MHSLIGISLAHCPNCILNPNRISHYYQLDQFIFVLRVVRWYFHYSNYNWTICKQTVETLIKCHILWNLIRVCTVCPCPIKRTLGLYGLIHVAKLEICTINYILYIWERSGSVVECLTRDRGAAGSSLNGVTALCPWAKHINPSLVLIQPRKNRPYITERLLMGYKEPYQTNKNN